MLVITNYTDPQFIRGQVKSFRPFTKKLFDDLKILKLADKYGCGILIKEKNKQSERSTLLKDSLADYKDVKIIKDCPDNNELIANAACVISAASTMAFKPVQMGVPMAVLRRHGAVGNFFDFPGLIDEDSRQMNEVLERQEKDGKCEKFIRETLTGGIDFSSIDKYVEVIEELL